MSYSIFLRDRAAVRDRGDWLVEFYPKDPSGVVTPLRYSRRGTVLGTASITLGADILPAHTPYRKRVIQAPTYTQSLWAPGRILSSSIPSYGVCKLTNRDGGLDQYAPRNGWQWAGCRYKVFFADRYDVAGTIGKVSDGVMGDPKFSIGEVEVPLNGYESLFNVPVSERVYRGTSYMLELAGDRTVSYGTPAAVNLTGSMTFESWYWIEALPTAASRQSYGWLDATRCPWRVDASSIGKLSVVCHIATVQEMISTTYTFAIQKPYHVAFTIAGRDVTFYIWDDDAQTLTTEVHTNAFSSATRDTNVAGTFSCSSRSDATFKPWWDEARVWNVARTADELKSNRFRPLSGSVPAACVHCAGFDNGTGTTVTDSSATAAHGTISGAGTSTWLWAQEGGPELAGAPKPDVWGQRFGCAPVVVDPVRNGYQVAGGGQVNAIASFAGGSAHTVDASAASYRAYIVAVPTTGHVLPYLPRGLFKLGLQPTLPVSANVQGYSGGPLGYVNFSHTVVRDVVTRRGPKLVDPTDLDTASFTAYAAANIGVMGVFLPNPTQRTIGSVLDFCVVNLSGWWGYRRASTQFRLELFAGPSVTPDHRYTQKHIVAIDPLPPTAVIYKVVVRYRENNVVLDEGQVAAAVKSTPDWQNWTKQWLEEESSDDVLRAAYPGEASIPVTFDTGLQYAVDAKALADYLLALLKGKKEGWNTTVVSDGYEVTPGQTTTQEVVLQRDVDRLGQDGTKTYAVLGVADNRQQGTVVVTNWG